MENEKDKLVDISLVKGGQVMELRNKEDGINSLFVDFYKKTNKNYQSLQEMLIRIMQKNGFRLGKRREYFHFNYEPQIPINY